MAVPAINFCGHCLDIKDYLAAAVVYETLGEWPQVTKHDSQKVTLLSSSCY